jgi:hypothetical protein
VSRCISPSSQAGAARACINKLSCAVLCIILADSITTCGRLISGGARLDATAFGRCCSCSSRWTHLQHVALVGIAAKQVVHPCYLGMISMICSIACSRACCTHCIVLLQHLQQLQLALLRWCEISLPIPCPVDDTCSHATQRVTNGVTNFVTNTLSCRSCGCVCWRCVHSTWSR